MIRDDLVAYYRVVFVKCSMPLGPATTTSVASPTNNPCSTMPARLSNSPANLAGSGMMSTGVEAFRLGLVGFLVPFAFVFQPALLLQGTLSEIIVATAMTGLGVACLAAFLIGHIWSPLNWFQRVLFFAAAFILVFPAIGMEIVGVLLAGALLVWAKIKK